MIVSEWLTCADPIAMLDYLHGRASDRKLRLFACACCRHYWHLLNEKPSRNAVLVAERFADGQATPQELEDAGEEAVDAGREGDGTGPVACCHFPPDQSYPVEAAKHAAREMIDVMNTGRIVSGGGELSDAEWRAELWAEADILRDIFGNPSRPAVIDPVWLTPGVITLARSIDNERAFDHMPFLGDALEEAGCDKPDILDHCRSQNQHFRGCWVIDVILGKS